MRVIQKVRGKVKVDIGAKKWNLSSSFLDTHFPCTFVLTPHIHVLMDMIQ